MFAKGTQLEEITVDGRSLAFAMRPGGPHCIVFLHGLGCSKESFKDAFNKRYFDESITLLAPDFLGHGESDRDISYTYDLPSQAELIRTLLRFLGIDRVVILAHSMGNVIGLSLAQRNLELLGFYCLEGNLIAEDCTLSSRIVKNPEKQFVEKIYPLAREQFSGGSGNDTRAVDPIALYRMSKSLTDHCDGNRQLSMFLNLPTDRAYFYGEATTDLRVLKLLSDTDVISVPDSGHFLMIDNPDFVYRTIAQRVLCHGDSR